MGTPDLSAVVTRDENPVVRAFDADGPCPLQQMDAPLGEVGLQHRGNLGILGGEDLLSTDDQCHLGAE